MEKNQKEGDGHLSPSFTVGAIALAFLIVGYQSALFIHKAAVSAIVARHEASDTLFVFSDTPDEAALKSGSSVVTAPNTDSPVVTAPKSYSLGVTTLKSEAIVSNPRSQHLQTGFVPNYKARSEVASKIVEKYGERSYESFVFDPNTVSVRDLERLGFSARQAASIDSYRRKGGRFRRKEDFAKSYVVSDSVYQRLEPYIVIPKTDINKADSAAFDALPGIGPYFASKMVEYRKRLHGYSFEEQLMDIYHFDEEKFSRLAGLIETGPHRGYPLWSLPEDSLTLHPYIGKYAAHGIVLFRKNNPPDKWSVRGLVDAGILTGDNARKMLQINVEAE